MTSEIRININEIQADLQYLSTLSVTERECSGSLLAAAFRSEELIENRMTYRTGYAFEAGMKQRLKFQLQE